MIDNETGLGNLNYVLLVRVDSGLSARLIGPFIVDRLLPQAPNGSSEIENPCQDPNLHSTFLCDWIGTLKILRRRYPAHLHRACMIGPEKKSCVHCR